MHVFFFAFLIVAVICLTVLQIIKLSLKHAENMKRIAHGYPTLDGAMPEHGGETGGMERLQ
jgi:hypothetical protein